MKVKRSIPHSILAAYACPRSKTRFVVWLALLLIIILVVCFFFIPQPMRHSVSNAPPIQPDPQEVSARLSENLHWLNTSAQNPSPIIQGVRAVKHSIKRNLSAAITGHITTAPVGAKRLAASCLLPLHTTGHSQSAPRKAVLAASGEHVLLAGEMIRVTLETAIQSDLPGPVRALVSEPIYASTAHNVLVPVGSRIIGDYSSGVFSTQNRLAIHWQRLILPDGRGVRIDSPAVGPVGRVGVAADQVKRHFWQRFGGASLSALLSTGAQLSGGLSMDTQTAGQQVRSNVSDSFATTADSLLKNTESIVPTIYLNPGAEIAIFLLHDLEL